MKNNPRTTNSGARRAPYWLTILLTCLLPTVHASQAGSATWNLNRINGNWNTAANWTPETVPNGSADTATFAVSNQTDISLSDLTEVDAVSFSPGAFAFTISANPGSYLNITGTGITNNSATIQNFIAGGSFIEAIQFFNGATAGDLTMFTAKADTLTDGFGGQISFVDSSAAGSGMFVIEGGAVSGGFVPGRIIFAGSSSAGTASFITNVGQVAGAGAGYVQFRDSSTADHGTFMTNGTASDFNNRAHTAFTNTSSGGNASFTSFGSPVTGGFGGDTSFSDSSTAGNATLIASARSIGVSQHFLTARRGKWGRVYHWTFVVGGFHFGGLPGDNLFDRRGQSHRSLTADWPDDTDQTADTGIHGSAVGPGGSSWTTAARPGTSSWV